MPQLENLKVAVLATDGFEESELTEPVRALREAGANVCIVSEKRGKIQAFKHHDKSIQIEVDRTLKDVSAADFDAVILPGGALNADRLRSVPEAKSFVREIQEAKKPIAVICHGPWLLASADLLKNRKITSYFTIQDDLKNAGAIWSDQEVVVDDNLISSRMPDDLPAFNRELVKQLSQYQKVRENKKVA